MMGPPAVPTLGQLELALTPAATDHPEQAEEIEVPIAGTRRGI